MFGRMNILALLLICCTFVILNATDEFDEVPVSSAESASDEHSSSLETEKKPFLEMLLHNLHRSGDMSGR
jgi:hypothetical protein